jgi:F420H(2)-dependent quinone reductase
VRIYRRVITDRFYSRFSSALGVAGLRAVGKLNVPLYRASGGRIGGRLNRAPILLLTTTGRKSGEPRTAPVLYLRQGENLVVIGSNAGNAKTPAWSLNLQANADAEVEIGRKKRRVHARVAEGEERERLWRAMNDQYAGFDDYAERTGRDIKLFVLQPRD